MGRYQFLISPHWLIRCYAYQIDSADGKGLPTHNAEQRTYNCY